MKHTETLQWITDGSLPDSETTVLLCDQHKQVGEAFHDGDAWRWASSSLVRTKVIGWAEMPAGPQR